MKKRTLYVLTALVFVVSGVVPVFCSDSWGGYLSLAATLLAALCTLLTLVIAIMLYDRFSLEREMAGRQFEEVLKLKQGLLRHQMPFFWKDSSVKAKTTWIYADGRLPNLPMDLLDKKRLLWSHDALGEFGELTKDIQTLLLPEEVEHCLNWMPGSAWGIMEPSYSVHDAECFIGSVIFHPDWGEDVRLWEDINHNNNSVRELCENFAHLNKVVEKCLREHDVYRMLNQENKMVIYGKEYPADYDGQVEAPKWAHETYKN